MATTTQTNGEHCINSIKAVAKKQRPMLARTWSDTYEIEDIEIPGTPKTPRTSTTPGTKYKIYFSFIIFNGIEIFFQRLNTFIAVK